MSKAGKTVFYGVSGWTLGALVGFGIAVQLDLSAPEQAILTAFGAGAGLLIGLIDSFDKASHDPS